MSKQFLGQSVWAKFVGGVTGRLGLNRQARRRPNRKASGSTLTAQVLESRTVPAATALTAAFSGGTLTLTALDGTTEEISVATGATSSVIKVGGVVISQIQGASATSISKIDLVTADTTDSLTISGITATLTVNMDSAQTITASSGPLTVNADGALALGASKVTGSLTIVAGGDVSDFGKLTVSGTTTITAIDSSKADKSISLDTSGNSFGKLVLTGKDASIVEAADVEFGAIDLSGNLTLVTTGNVTQSAGVDVTGAATITATARNVTLSNSANVFGSLTVTGKDVSIQEAGDTVITTLTAGGKLTLVSTGDITDTGRVNVVGITNVKGQSIELNSVSNTFGQLLLESTGGKVTIVENAASDIGKSTVVGGALSVTSQGAVTQTGVITAVDTTINAAANLVTLGLSNILSGAVSLTGSMATLKNTVATKLGTISTSGALTVTSGGAVTTDDKAISVGGLTTINAPTFDVTLSSTASVSLGTVAIKGAAVVVDEDTALDFGACTITNSLTATSGDKITDTGKISVTNKASFTANTGKSDVILDSQGSAYGSIQAVGNNVQIVETGDTVLDAVSSTSSFSLKSSGAVTQASAVSLLGTVSISATKDITLTSTNTLGTTTISGAAVQITENDAVVLGTVVAKSAKIISTSGAITGTSKLTIAGDSTFTANSGASNITLSSTLNTFGTLALTGQDVTVIEALSTILGDLDVNGNLILTSSGEVTNPGAIDVTGAATISANKASITLGKTTPSKFGSLSLTGGVLTVTESDATELGTVSGTSLTLTSGGAVTQTAGKSVVATGKVTISAAGANVTLGESGNSFGSIAVPAGAVVTIVESNSTELAGTNLSDKLTVTSGGAVTDTASITAVDTKITAAGDVTLDTYNASYGAISVTGKNTVLSNTSTGKGVVATTWDLDAMTITGNLTVTTSDVALSAITDSGVVSVSGNATFNAGINGDITLSENNLFGTLSFKGKAVSIHEESGMALGASSAANGLTLTAAGPITQSGALAVTGIASITADDGAKQNITLNHSSNSFSTTVLLDGAAVTISDSTALTLGTTSASSDFAAISKGDISDSGVLSLSSKSSFTSTGAKTELDQVNTLAGAVSFTGSQLTISNVSALTMGTVVAGGTVSLTTTSGAVALGTSTIGGGLNITSGAGVSDAGKLTITGATAISAAAGSDVLLNTTKGHTFGKISVSSGDDVAIEENASTELGTIDIDGNLTVVSSAEVFDTGVLSIGKDTVITAGVGKAVTLDSASTFTGSLGVNGGSAVIDKVGAVILGASAVTGSYTLTATGNISQTGTLTISGLTTLKATGLTIDLNDTNNVFGTIVISNGKDVTIGESANVDFGTSTITGDLTVVSLGNVTDSGALTVTGATDITATNKSIVLDSTTGKFTGAVAATAGSLTLSNITATVLDNIDLSGNISVTSGGNVSQVASSTFAVDGTTTISAATKTITLNESGTALAGAVSFTGTTVQLTNSVATVLGNSTATGTLTVIATDQDITSTASALTVTGAVSLDAGTGDINVNLTNSKLSSTLALDGAAVTVTGNSAFNLGAVTATGNLSITTSGNVTDTGKIDVGGTATINAGSLGNVELDGGTNVIDGTISLTCATAVIVNTVATDLGAISAKGNFNLTSESGEVTNNTGTITVGGALSIDTELGLAYQDVTLTSAASTFGSLLVRGENVTIVENSSLDLGLSKINGNFSLTTYGSVSSLATGKIEVGGTTAITANNFGSITLTVSSSTFAGALSLSGQNVTINSSGALDFDTTSVAGNLSIVTTGDVTDTQGPIVVLGKTYINVGGNKIELTDAGRSFGQTPDLTGGTVSY